MYTQFTDFLSYTEEVRRLARKVVTTDFDEDDIRSYQYKVYSLIRTLTDKDDWDEDDREFGALQLYETEIAAQLIKQHYGTTQQAADAGSSIESLLKSLATLIDNIDTSIGAISSRIRRTDYKSWNLNPAVEVPRRGLTVT